MQGLSHIQPKLRKTITQPEDLKNNPELGGMIPDPIKKLGRYTLWIDTNNYNSIYARASGDPSASKLILLVHGSGPRNSSLWWTEFTHELLLRCAEGSFYCVAIDCPGYGNSPGDKQTIRSEPGHFLKDVITALGHDNAYCLYGSSQGACAIFNAVLQYPTLTRFIAVRDPVGHDVFRYHRITQPCLLLFDTDDEGHPVKVYLYRRDP